MYVRYSAGQQSVGAKIARLMRLGMVQMWAMSNSPSTLQTVKFTPFSPTCKSSLRTGGQTGMTDITQGPKCLLKVSLWNG